MTAKQEKLLGEVNQNLKLVLALNGVKIVTEDERLEQEYDQALTASTNSNHMPLQNFLTKHPNWRSSRNH